jgi:hypothetical protein
VAYRVENNVVAFLVKEIKILLNLIFQLGRVDWVRNLDREGSLP